MNHLNIIKFSQFLKGEQEKINSLMKESLIKEDQYNDEELSKSLNKLIESEKVKTSDKTEFLQPSKDYKGEPEVEDVFDPTIDMEDYEISSEEPEELDEEESIPEAEYDVKKTEEGPGDEKVIKSEQIKESFYDLYRDKTEDFTCELKIQGATIDQTDVRLVIESENWNIMFRGNIDNYGRCLIPMKKLNILNEGETGIIKLEVIAENTVFVPWEENFKVKNSKKVNFVLNENKKEKKTVTILKTDVRAKLSRRK